MPCVTAGREEISRIAAAVEADPRTEVSIDIANERVSFAGQVVRVSIRESARDALVNGRWDPIGELIDGSADAGAVASTLRYMAL
jgi:3-isopropylmalate/(R)-2-methylmalate dehydratase small subunit